MNRVRTILRAVISLVFVIAAGMKMLHPGIIPALGYPVWFGMLIALAELAAVAGLWIPKYAQAAAFGLILIMFGAIYTHMHAGDPQRGILPVLLLFGLVRLAGIRR